ncbi:MAG TPA: GNAT family N-acetyltransferase [Candidatus Sulfotelmatobacter sp.]|nr:GNAT family N-acetyltransferase [Candidatus Sulfotelmatobacter sp.]
MATLPGNKFRFEPLGARHDRAAFSCEHERLNTYLKQQAGQDIRKRVAAVYVLTPDGKTIAGYYTLSQYAINAGDLPEELVRNLRLPKYDKLPATLLGRLARSGEFKGAGLGEMLLMDALKKALDHSWSVASMAIVVDSKDERARSFYKSYGFIDLPEHASRLFIPMKTVEELLRD